MDVVILSNAPGEVATWVYPFVRALHDRQAPIRISVVLSPCSHASGNEADVVASFAGVARVLPPDRFWDFLLWGKTPGWDWHSTGVVVFLGGDQFFTVVIGRRLGYRTVIYAEGEARWIPWIDRFALRQPLPQVGTKGTVIGDLMTEVSRVQTSQPPRPYLVFLPGSKEMKLRQGVPLCLGIADCLRQRHPDLQFFIALAPTLTPEKIARYATIEADIARVGGAGGRLVTAGGSTYLLTPSGTQITLYEPFPAHALFVGAQLCVTTVGANTAQLAALGVPMVVLLPTNQWDAMRGWDGLGGLVGNIPGLGSLWARVINRWVVQRIRQQGKLLAWPNIWAQQPIVPEYLGHLTAEGIALEVTELLQHPTKLNAMRQALGGLVPQGNVAEKLVEIVLSGANS